jgi:hypothetical protein
MLASVCKSAVKMLCALAGIPSDGQLQAICLWNFSNIQNTAIVVSNVMWPEFLMPGNGSRIVPVPLTSACSTCQREKV